MVEEKGWEVSIVSDTKEAGLVGLVGEVSFSSSSSSDEYLTRLAFLRGASTQVCSKPSLTQRLHGLCSSQPEWSLRQVIQAFLTCLRFALAWLLVVDLLELLGEAAILFLLVWDSFLNNCSIVWSSEAFILVFFVITCNCPITFF